RGDQLRLRPVEPRGRDGDRGREGVPRPHVLHAPQVPQAVQRRDPHRVARPGRAVHRHRAGRHAALPEERHPGLRPRSQSQHPVTSSGDPRTRRESEIPGAGVLGMWIFLATLSMLFLASIAGYLVVRLKAPAWPPPGMPRLPSGLWLSTGLLLAGSVTVHLALLRIRLGQRTATVRYLLATTGLALA